jgi:5-methylcytosine-specific restriction endonuclease McrA
VSRPNQSRFYQECQRVIYNASAETAAIPPIHVQFDAEADGYAGDTWVQIQNQQEEAFLTDWKGSDPTRFPQGVKAAATALRDAGRLGQFRIWHQKGDLIILSDEHQHVSPERLIDSETSETDASPARDSSSHREGKQAAYQATRYERSAQARKDCIDHYGAECVVCGVDFGERYGELAEGFIHVHHLTPIAEVDEEYEIDPIEDLRPVCPNCHAVIHRRSPPLSISEVRSLLTLE